MTPKKTACVLGAGGFIGSHLVKRLKAEGYWVRGVDLKYPEFSETEADEFLIMDLRSFPNTQRVLWSPNQRTESDGSFDIVFQLAADMGGAGYIFTGEHDADVMHNSAQINLNVAEVSKRFHVKKIFYSSSACMYPAYNQEDPKNPKCAEHTAYPAAPDSEYGWEKLFSERLYDSYRRNYGLNIRIARFHNIFGEESCYCSGKEKAPAALSFKVAKAKDFDVIEVWGSGEQTRSFLHVSECIEGILRLCDSDCYEPVNIGSEEMVTINNLALMIANIADKHITIKNDQTKPQGVAGRNSDNKMIFEKLGWKPSQKLAVGLEKTYSWILQQVNNGTK